MFRLLTAALVLTSFSSFAETFTGRDNLGRDCSVTLTPTAKKKISTIAINAEGIELIGEVKSSTRVLKIKNIKILSREGETITDLERRAEVILEEGKPLSFSIQSNVVKSTEIQVTEYYPRGGVITDSTYRDYPRTYTDFKFELVSSSVVECTL